MGANPKKFPDASDLAGKAPPHTIPRRGGPEAGRGSGEGRQLSRAYRKTAGFVRDLSRQKFNAPGRHNNVPASPSAVLATCLSGAFFAVAPRRFDFA